MILIHSQLMIPSFLAMEVERVNKVVRESPNVQTIGPNMDLWPDRFGGEVMLLPSVFRTASRVERSVEAIMDDLDRVIQSKRQEVKALRDSNAPPAMIVEVETVIDVLTREFRTLVDHSRAIT